MKTEAILYTSRTGHTRRYAELLGQALELPVFSLEEGASRLPRGSGVIYLGWLRVSRVQGYRKAARRFSVLAVCGVGLCDTGTMLDQVRKASAIPASIPLFTLQGGLDRGQLKGASKLLIAMLTKGLTDQKQRSAQDQRMLELLTRDGSYVSPENLREPIDWYRMGKP